jgi:hypothetical protein
MTDIPERRPSVSMWPTDDRKNRDPETRTPSVTVRIQRCESDIYKLVKDLNWRKSRDMAITQKKLDRLVELKADLKALKEGTHRAEYGRS